ncbi:MAG TPA: heterodisulfide reductase-related iron-sulfur binding cluster [Myxococcales bacterium]
MKLPIAEQDFSHDVHGMAYDNPQFWDEPHLETELHRVFEICNGCRLCFNLCPSFDVLFRRIDALDPHREEAEGKHIEAGRVIEEHEAAELLKHVTVATENPVSLLQAEDNERVVELCYECKLCFPKCPYVPPHEFAVDFPKLMLRAKMIWAKEDGIAFREKFLGATDAVGSVMTKIAPFANAAAHNKFNRMLMEQTLGIHQDRQLPPYADESFMTWAHRRAPVAPGDTKVALFATCFVNYNDPRIGKAAVDVLERAGCAVDCPEQVCCGMPKLDGGDIEGARKLARKNLETLLPAVRAGAKIVSPGPSCTLMLKTEYPELVPGEESKEFAAAVVDLSDFVLQQARAKKLPKPPAGAVGKVAFHVACHNRVQNFGYRGRDLLKWAGGDVTLVDRCCGMDGTWGMKAEFFEESLKVAEGAARKVDAAEPAVVSSDCPLAGMQLTQKTGRTSYHPVRILQAAYSDEPLRSPKPTSDGDDE